MPAYHRAIMQLLIRSIGGRGERSFHCSEMVWSSDGTAQQRQNKLVKTAGLDMDKNPDSGCVEFSSRSILFLFHCTLVRWYAESVMLKRGLAGLSCRLKPLSHVFSDVQVKECGLKISSDHMSYDLWVMSISFDPQSGIPISLNTWVVRNINVYYDYVALRLIYW